MCEIQESLSRRKPPGVCPVVLSGDPAGWLNAFQLLHSTHQAIALQFLLSWTLNYGP
jgi:hypothetical protein